MTVPAFAEEFGRPLPSADEKASANQLRRLIAAQASGGARLRVLDDQAGPVEITLAPELSKTLLELLRHIGSGDAVTLVPVSRMLSTQQAADILNVSRPYLVSLLDKGVIEHELVGRHRRIKAEKLFAYKRARDAERADALGELAELDADLLQPVFANRYTAFIDACTLASVLRRNLLLTLAEAEFFRVRWSGPVLDETERAIDKMLDAKGVVGATARAQRSRAEMERAFADAMVLNFDRFLPAATGLPDPGDAHVLAAALKTRAAVIVTENLKHFPPALLAQMSLEARSADAFIADTIALDPPRAVPAVRRMRERFQRPEKTAEALLLDMEAAGLAETVDVLRAYVQSL